jgi:hypothetical protein
MLTIAALVGVVVVAVDVMTTVVAAMRETVASRRPRLMARTMPTTTTTLHRRLHLIWLR